MKKYYLLNFKEINERFLSLFDNLSRAELATLFAVSLTAISNWHTGRKKVPWDKLAYAVQSKNVTWDWLLDGRDPKYRY